MKVRYKHNNSGGRWWLADEDWRALESAGWKVCWFAQEDCSFYKDGRFLGALAQSATRADLTLGEAISEFESITGQCADEQGCPCCGQPHYFYEVEDDEQ